MQKSLKTGHGLHSSLHDKGDEMSNSVVTGNSEFFAWQKADVERQLNGLLHGDFWSELRLLFAKSAATESIHGTQSRLKGGEMAADRFNLGMKQADEIRSAAAKRLAGAIVSAVIEAGAGVGGIMHARSIVKDAKDFSASLVGKKPDEIARLTQERGVKDQAKLMMLNFAWQNLAPALGKLAQAPAEYSASIDDAQGKELQAAEQFLDSVLDELSKMESHAQDTARSSSSALAEVRLPQIQI